MTVIEEKAIKTYQEIMITSAARYDLYKLYQMQNYQLSINAKHSLHSFKYSQSVSIENK